MSDKPTLTNLNFGELLRQHTPARVALGRTGPSIPTNEQLRFQLDHALARDAVHASFDASTIIQALQQRNLPYIELQSAAASEPTRHLYLRRPDLGRTLAPQSVEGLRQRFADSQEAPDILFVIADGLSALAVERHALPLLDATMSMLTATQGSIGPVCIVHQGRVAIGDEIGKLLNARLTVTLIGERPGLSAPDSLGVYITWRPRPGRTDAERNCISNIRHEGLSYLEAARRIVFYINGANQLQATGIALKENPALADPERPPAP
jgi:ethanolamine ammonia-lyase small subunit